MNIKSVFIKYELQLAFASPSANGQHSAKSLYTKTWDPIFVLQI